MVQGLKLAPLRLDRRLLLMISRLASPIRSGKPIWSGSRKEPLLTLSPSLQSPIRSLMHLPTWAWRP